jgi:hypothetical protein
MSGRAAGLPGELGFDDIAVVVERRRCDYLTGDGVRLVPVDSGGMPWEIAGLIGPHSDPDFAGHGWVWAIHRGEGTAKPGSRSLPTIDCARLLPC